MSMVAPVFHREPVANRPRKRWSKTERAQIFLQGNGRCSICGQKITSPDWHAEHDITRALTQEDRLEDMRPAHPACNRRKNNTVDTPLAAKALRQGEAGIPRKGEERPPSRLRGPGFDKTKSRKMNGQVKERRK